MRHFSGMTPSIRSLARRMLEGSRAFPLVARPGPPQRLAPADAGAPRGAVDVAVITAPADAHQSVATSAVVKPVVLDDRDPGRRETGQRSAIAVFNTWEVAIDDRDDPPEGPGAPHLGLRFVGGRVFLHPEQREQKTGNCAGSGW